MPVVFVSVLRSWAVTGILLPLSACQPVVLEVGQEPPVSVQAPDARSDARGTDGAASDAEIGDAGADGAAPADAGGLTACQNLPKPGFVFLQAGLSVMTLDRTSCAVTDAGEPPASGIYSLSAGGLLMRAGQRYAISWPNAQVNKLQLSGGGELCATEPIYQELPSSPALFGTPTLPEPACRSFVAPVDVRYLRVPGDDVAYVGGLVLCPGECELDAGLDGG